MCYSARFPKIFGTKQGLTERLLEQVKKPFFSNIEAERLLKMMRACLLPANTPNCWR